MTHNKQIFDSAMNRNGKLFARCYPSETEGRPLIILHGLLGSSRNWTSIAQELSEHRPVWTLDLPDHGASHWTETPAFAEMTASIYEWTQTQGLTGVDWIGHSMGGKVALRMAWEYPETVSSLVLADIYPKVYEPHHKDHLKAMLETPLDTLASRKDADTYLQTFVESWPLRQFLLTNLEKDRSSDTFYWLPNLQGLYEQLEHLAALSIPQTDTITQPTLLLYGGRSNFVSQEDIEEMPNQFPRYVVSCLPNAGHNLHMEDRPGFIEAVSAFFESSNEL